MAGIGGATAEPISWSFQSIDIALYVQALEINDPGSPRSAIRYSITDCGTWQDESREKRMVEAHLCVSEPFPAIQFPFIQTDGTYVPVGGCSLNRNGVPETPSGRVAEKGWRRRRSRCHGLNTAE